MCVKEAFNEGNEDEKIDEIISIINKVSKPVAIFLALGHVSFLKFLEKEKSSKNKVQPIRRRRNE